jgi:threonine/homoserine/homoserine lactone efflux protein
MRKIEQLSSSERTLMTLEFFFTSLIVIASPGTGALITIAAGLSRGARASLVAAFGCTLGIVPHMLAAITGLAALLHASALAFELIRYAGVVYLLYMAWMSLKERGALSVDAHTSAEQSGLQIIRHAILANLLNPKLSIFFLAFLPQFVQAEAAHPTWLMLQLSGFFMALTFVVFGIYGVFAAQARKHVLARPRVLQAMRWGFAACFVALSARLATTSR